MRVNKECIRKILMKVEEIPYGETITVSKLQEELKDFSIEEVISAATMLNRERFIMIIGKPGYDDDDVLRDNKIRCLTERGCRSLDLIRDDDTWNLLKEKMPNFNNLTIFMVLSTASKIMNDKQNKLFDLSDNYYYDYSRW